MQSKCCITWSTTNEFATTVDWEVYLHYNTKQKALFLFLIMWPVRFIKLLLACVPFPTLRATSIVAILQAPDGKDGSYSIVWITATNCCTLSYLDMIMVLAKTIYHYDNLKYTCVEDGQMHWNYSGVYIHNIARECMPKTNCLASTCV